MNRDWYVGGDANLIYREQVGDYLLFLWVDWKNGKPFWVVDIRNTSMAYLDNEEYFVKSQAETVYNIIRPHMLLAGLAGSSFGVGPGYIKLIVEERTQANVNQDI